MIPPHILNLSHALRHLPPDLLRAKAQILRQQPDRKRLQRLGKVRLHLLAREEVLPIQGPERERQPVGSVRDVVEARGFEQGAHVGAEAQGSAVLG